MNNAYLPWCTTRVAPETARWSLIQGTLRLWEAVIGTVRSTDTPHGIHTNDQSRNTMNANDSEIQPSANPLKTPTMIT